MEHDKFEENLLLYGSDLQRWPEDALPSAQNALRNDTVLRDMMEKEGFFENETRRAGIEDDPAFAARITMRALQKASPELKQNWFALFLQDLRDSLPVPQPAYAFALIAIMGFALGLFIPSDVTNSLSPETLLYDTRDML